MSLDRLQALLAIQGAQQTARAIPMKNDPPQFVFSQKTAVLVAIDGDPVWRPVTGTALARVINTRALVLLDDASGKYYIHLFDGFVEATVLSGPWTVARAVPNGANQVAQELAQQRVVDLMEGPPDEQDATKRPLLASTVPDIIVTTIPAVAGAGAAGTLAGLGDLVAVVSAASGEDRDKHASPQDLRGVVATSQEASLVAAADTPLRSRRPAISLP